MLSKAPRGTKDITPKDVYKWHYVEKNSEKSVHYMDMKK